MSYVRRSCESLLQRFLEAIHKRSSSVNFSGMINVIITHIQSQDPNTQVGSFHSTLFGKALPSQLVCRETEAIRLYRADLAQWRMFTDIL